MGTDGNVLSWSSGFALKFAYHFSERHIQIPWFLLDFWRVFSEDFLDLNRALFGFDVRWVDPVSKVLMGLSNTQKAHFYWTSPVTPLFYSGSTPRFPYMCAAYIYLCIHCIIHCIRIWGVKCRLQDDTRGPVKKNALLLLDCPRIVQKWTPGGYGMVWVKPKNFAPREDLNLWKAKILKARNWIKSTTYKKTNYKHT